MKKRISKLLSIGIVAGTVFIGTLRGIHESLKQDRPSKKRKYGNAAKDFRERYLDEDPDYNMLLSQDLALSFNQSKTNRSLQSLIVGGPGSGRTYKFVEPNLLQDSSSKVVFDPSGLLFKKYAPYLLKKGYHVSHFNLIDCKGSHFNPLMYLYDKDGQISVREVDFLAEIIANHCGSDKCDPLWKHAIKSLVGAIVCYILENRDIEFADKCFKTVVEKLNLFFKHDGSKKNLLDEEIHKWEEKCKMNGQNVEKTMQYYNTFMLVAPSVISSTITMVINTLSIFTINDIDRMTRTDLNFLKTDLNIDIDELAQVPTALFISFPYGHDDYKLLKDIMYALIYSRLYDLGERRLTDKWLLEERHGFPLFMAFDSEKEVEDFIDHVSEDNIVEKTYGDGTKCYYITYNSKVYQRSIFKSTLLSLINRIPNMKLRNNKNYPRLPINVSFIYDNFEKVGALPNLITILSTSRKYHINNCLLISSFDQLKMIYPDKGEFETVLANVDTTIFLGSSSDEDKEQIEKMCGYTCDSAVERRPYRTTEPTIRPVISVSDINLIEEIDDDLCIVMVRDTVPMVDKKYNLKTHPHYKEFKDITETLKDCNFELKRYYNDKTVTRVYHEEATKQQLEE